LTSKSKKKNIRQVGNTLQTNKYKAPSIIKGMWWLSGDVVAQWGCGGSVVMWWLSGDVVAQWGCGGSVG
jgi:hypothetical protein